MRAADPRACALGYDLAPLPGLGNGSPQRGDFVSEPLTQDTSAVSAKRLHNALAVAPVMHGGTGKCHRGGDATLTGVYRLRPQDPPLTYRADKIFVFGRVPDRFL